MRVKIAFNSTQITETKAKEEKISTKKEVSFHFPYFTDKITFPIRLTCYLLALPSCQDFEGLGLLTPVISQSTIIKLDKLVETSTRRTLPLELKN